MKFKAARWSRAIGQYFHHQVILASLVIILAVPAGLLIIRLSGFSPTTQTYTALETIVENLCWVPLFVGWLKERKKVSI